MAKNAPRRPSAAQRLAPPSLKMLDRIRALLAGGKLTDAVVMAKMMTLRIPNDPLGWKTLGICYCKLGQNGEAVVPLQKAASLMPKDSETLTYLGNAHWVLGQLESAALCYQKATEIKPDDPIAHNGLGCALARMGRPSEAEQCFRRTLALRNGDLDALTNLGNVLHMQRRFGEAVTYYRLALILQPNNPQILRGLGLFLSDLGAVDQASTVLCHCLSLDPKDTTGAQGLLAALGTGPTPTQPSRQYLEQIYRQRSTNWDNINGCYFGHELVAATLRDLMVGDTKIDILDLGCGTGLVGERLRDLALILDGVDLSLDMLKKAQEKRLYTNLFQTELIEHLEKSTRTYGAITSAATLIHFGDLSVIFSAVSKKLNVGGLFVFTVFPLDGEKGQDDFGAATIPELARNGCFAHSEGYIRKVAAESGFIVERLALEIHEYHNDATPVMAFIVAARRQTDLSNAGPRCGHYEKSSRDLL